MVPITGQNMTGFECFLQNYFLVQMNASPRILVHTGSDSSSYIKNEAFLLKDKQQVDITSCSK